MTDNIDRVKSTIKKLLDLADSSEYEGEINNAIKFARELMLKHGFEETEIRSQVEVEEDLSDFNLETVSTLYQRIKDWEINLGYAVCDIVGYCQYYIGGVQQVRNELGLISFTESGPKSTQTFKFYGPRKYVNLAVSIYRDLAHIINGMAVLKYGSAYQGSGKNYAQGFVKGLREQIKEADKKVIEELKLSNSTALVSLEKNFTLVKRNKKEAIDWLKTEKKIRFVRKKSSYSNKNFDQSAFDSGKKDGSRVNIKGTKQTRQKRLKG